MKQLFFSCTLMLFALILGGQSIYLRGDAAGTAPALARQLAAHTLFSADAETVFNALRHDAPSEEFTLHIALPGLLAVEARLRQVNLFDEDFSITNDKGKQSWNTADLYTLQGEIVGQKKSKVTLTVAADMLAGAIQLNDGHTYFIEPLRYFAKGAAGNLYVLYDNGDVLEGPQTRNCLAAEAAAYAKRDLPPSARCKPLRLDVGLANDYGMVEWMGSQTAVIQHNMTIMNLVQSNYDDEFDSPLRINVVSIFVSSCDACDPWSATDDHDELYIEFSNWVNQGGLGSASIDWAGLYTPREFTLLFAAYTYPGGLCNYYRTTLFSFYEAPLCTQQKIAARALGRSLGAGGASSGIMSSGGSCTNDWHPTSVDEINYALATMPCLSECTANPPAQPLSMTHINTPTMVCYTFNAPCVASYQVGTNDLTLSVTTAGTTICLQSTAYGPRTARVYVSAIDHCGRPSDLAIAWTVNIDMGMALGGHNPEGQSIDIDMLRLTAGPNEVFIQDSHELPLGKTLQLYDLTGRLLMEHAINDASARISLEHLPQGMYAARLLAPGRETITKTVYRF